MWILTLKHSLRWVPDGRHQTLSDVAPSVGEPFSSIHASGRASREARPLPDHDHP